MTQSINAQVMTPITSAATHVPTQRLVSISLWLVVSLDPGYQPRFACSEHAVKNSKAVAPMTPPFRSLLPRLPARCSSLTDGPSSSLSSASVLPCVISLLSHRTESYPGKTTFAVSSLVLFLSESWTMTAKRRVNVLCDVNPPFCRKLQFKHVSGTSLHRRTNQRPEGCQS